MRHVVFGILGAVAVVVTYVLLVYVIGVLFFDYPLRPWFMG